jgi:hypothetical protein
MARKGQAGNRFAGVFETPVVTAGPAAGARGRGHGKHSDASYVKVGHYARKTTHLALKITLEMRGMEFSEAFEKWALQWLCEQHGVSEGEEDPGRVILERLGVEIPS